MRWSQGSELVNTMESTKDIHFDYETSLIYPEVTKKDQEKSFETVLDSILNRVTNGWSWV